MTQMFTALKPLVLASASPRRQDFLNSLGLEYTVIPALAPEPEIEEGEKPCAFTMRAASQKAWEVFKLCQTSLPKEGLPEEALPEEALPKKALPKEGLPEEGLPEKPSLPAAPCTVIGADTVVALGDEVMGKPQTKEEALDMLLRLAGQPQTVYTGCSIIIPQQQKKPKEVCFFASSQVRMHNFAKHILEAYVQTGEPMDKAGAYAIQGIGAFLVAEVKGSWTNIVGLPLDELVQVLLENKIIAAHNF